MKRINNVMWFLANAAHFCPDPYDTRKGAREHIGELDEEDNPFTYVAKVRLTEIVKKKKKKVK